MALSRFLRRSGIAVVLIMDHLDWIPDMIYQVGVGIFHEEIPVMKEAWPNCGLIGFEPHPRTFKDISKTYPGLLIETAVADYGGKGTLTLKKRHRDGASMYGLIHRDDEHYHDVEVKVATMDSMYPPPEGKTLFWVDCEGGELPVFKGASKFLDGVTVINVELTARKLGDQWSDTVEVHDYLMEKGFFLQHIHTHKSSAGQYDAIYVKRELFNPIYCCSPPEIKRYRYLRCEV